MTATTRPSLLPDTLYEAVPPSDFDEDIDVLTSLAFDRLSLLVELDTLRARGVEPKAIDARMAWMLFEVRMARGSQPEEKETPLQLQIFNDGASYRDIVSFFLLILAFAKAPGERQAWLARLEGDLMAVRARTCAPEVLDAFLVDAYKTKQIPCRPLERESFNKMRRYVVPFETVPSLVASRKVAVVAGEACVPSIEMPAFLKGRVTAAVRRHLARAAAHMAATAHVNEERECMQGTFAELVRQSTSAVTELMAGASPQSLAPGTLDPTTIDALSVYFPPCAQAMHSRLATVHHLKHLARQQLVSFFRSIGLALPGSLWYFNRMFAPSEGGAAAAAAAGAGAASSMFTQRFQKEYRYNIEHNYGKVGGMKLYNPPGCRSIIMSSDGQDCSGCPFKTHDPATALPQLLRQRLPNLPEATWTAIEDHVRGIRYQHACGLWTQALADHHAAHEQQRHGAGPAGAAPEPAVGVVVPPVPLAYEPIRSPAAAFQLVRGSADTARVAAQQRAEQERLHAEAQAVRRDARLARARRQQAELRSAAAAAAAGAGAEPQPLIPDDA